MKTAIYIEKGIKQIVLTPEDDFEKSILDDFNSSSKHSVSLHEGSFYHCQGGWARRDSTPSLIIKREVKDGG